MQFKQHSLSFLAFIIFSLISLFSFSMREVIVHGQAAEGDDLSRGVVPNGGLGE